MSNPMLTMVDIKKIVESIVAFKKASGRHPVYVAVDNTFLTPLFCVRIASFRKPDFFLIFQAKIIVFTICKS